MASATATREPTCSADFTMAYGSVPSTQSSTCRPSSPAAEASSEASSSFGITTDGVAPSAGITRQVNRSKDSAADPMR